MIRMTLDSRTVVVIFVIDSKQLAWGNCCCIRSRLGQFVLPGWRTCGCVP